MPETRTSCDRCDEISADGLSDELQPSCCSRRDWGSVLKEGISLDGWGE